MIHCEAVCFGYSAKVDYSTVAISLKIKATMEPPPF